MIEAQWHEPTTNTEIPFSPDAVVAEPYDPRIAAVQDVVRGERMAHAEKQRATWEETIDFLGRSRPNKIVVHNTIQERFVGGQAEWGFTILPDADEVNAPVAWRATIVAEKVAFTPADRELRAAMRDYVLENGRENTAELPEASIGEDGHISPLTKKERTFTDVARAAAEHADRLIVQVQPLERGVPDESAPKKECWIFRSQDGQREPDSLSSTHIPEVIQEIQGVYEAGDGSKAPISLGEVYDYLHTYYAGSMDRHELLADIVARAQGEAGMHTGHGLYDS